MSTRAYSPDCGSARRALARGGYAAHRVFFADEETAIAAGYRPCGHCLRERYAAWRRGPAPGTEYPWRTAPAGSAARADG